jgi:hypothetical protein
MKNALMVAAVLLLAAACTPEVPAAPTYAKDVQPILEAHCVRCHGANDMLNAVPGAPHPARPQPQLCYFQRLGDEGDCTADPANCKRGAGNPQCAGMLKTRITAPEDNDLRMPPAPSDPLNDWEQDVLIKWGANPLP